ncbi:MAG: penicillin-binding protein 2 [Fibrobacter sp.]|jgi:penicillin-binding protein 2|nr:penicillin-binding protein 2 [Fibrobacter sp.]
MLKGSFSAELDTEVRNRKILVFISCVLFAFLILSGRLFYLQYIRYEENYQNSENNRQRKVVLKAERGSIFDRTGKVLVRNRPSYQVVISARELKDKDSVFARLLNIRDAAGERVFDSATVDTAFQRSRWIRNRPLRILEDASPEQAALIEERAMDLPGVMTVVESRREYPYETMAAHVFGYTGELSEEELKKEEYQSYSLGDRLGKKGLEQQYEEEFRGRDGMKYVEVNAYGREVGLIQGMETQEAIPGHHLITTLDFDIQAAAEAAFPDSMRGAVVALDPRTGEILAMVSAPRLDPNIFSLRRRERNKGWAQVALDTTHPLTNRAISGVYPPASVFKLVSAGAGLEYGFVRPTTHMSKPCTGGYQFGSRYQRCWGTHGSLDLVNALRLSCDTYFYQLGLLMGMEPINEFGRRFGLGSVLGVDIPGERSGWLPDSVSFNARNKRSGWRWTRGLILNLSIGQGQLVTPLQEAALVGGIATGKGVYEPHLMKEIRDVDHELVMRYIPSKVHQGEMKPETHQMLLDAMDSVVNHPGGTGRRAALPGIRVGGKSGSGEWKKGEKTHAWFVSVAPLDNPQIAVATVIEAAGGGGAQAAPVCRKVMEAYFKKYPAVKEVQP